MWGLLGIPTGDVLMIAYWKLSTLTQYLTWFDKSPTSTGKAIWLYRERTIFTTIEEEESSTLCNSQPHSFLSLQCCNGSHCLLPLTAHSLLYFSYFSLHSLSFCSSSDASIYRLQWQLLLLLCQQWWPLFVNGRCSFFWQYPAATNTLPL